MKSVRWMVSYILVASLGLWLAFAVSIKFMAPAHSQSAPESGALPPEFTKEVEASQVPVPPPPPEAAIEAEAPVSDGATASSPQPSQFILTDGYVYDPSGKRDPFKPFRTMRPGGADKAKPIETLEPLQRWELERLQVVGILWDVRKPRAMVRDPDGIVYTVVKDSKIGRSEGFVAAIREGEVVVIETRYEDGNVTKEPRVLELKK